MYLVHRWVHHSTDFSWKGNFCQYHTAIIKEEMEEMKICLRLVVFSSRRALSRNTLSEKVRVNATYLGQKRLNKSMSSLHTGRPIVVGAGLV